MCESIPYMLPILRDGINLQYIFQYLESWEPIPKVLPGLAGRRKCSTARQPTSKPLFEHEMTQNSLLLTLKRPPKVISQSFNTLSEKLVHFSPLLTAASEIFGFSPTLTPKYQISDLGGDQYGPIYIPILREQLTNLQYQYLESLKTIFSHILTCDEDREPCSIEPCSGMLPSSYNPP
jgi:hypothetical protein